MQKKVSDCRPAWSGLRKFTKMFLVMKLTIVLLTAAILNVHGTVVSQTITLSGKELSLKKIFTAIEQQTGFLVFTSKEILEGTKPVSVRVSKMPLPDFLALALKDQPIDFLIEDRNIFLSRKPGAGLQPEGQTDNVNSAVTLFPVTGQVFDQDGVPLAGVNITVKGASQGVITEASGRFTFSADAGQTLVFSSVQFENKEVKINSASSAALVRSLSAGDDRHAERSSVASFPNNISIYLYRKTDRLDDVVVVGYGTRRKSSVTGSVASVKSADLKVTPIANLAQGLQGRVAGLDMRQASGLPGGNVSIRIRGTNSINGSSEPLYVIDGIQVSAGSDFLNTASPLAQINPSDIESVEILKDAGATAVYGARGSNGVVLITTKRGKNGITHVTYDGYYGQQETTKTMDILNAAEFARLENEIYSPNVIYADPAAMGKGIDYQDLMFRKAVIQSHQLSVTGGNEKTQVALGLNYFNQDGIIKKSNYKRYALRSNVDHTISQVFKAGASLYYTVNAENRVPVADEVIDAAWDGTLGRMIAAVPTLKPYRDDGSIYPFADQFSGRYRENRNPLTLLENKSLNSTYRFLANVYLTANISKNLSYRGSFNADMITGLGVSYSPLYILDSATLANPLAINGSAGNSNSYRRTLLHESQLNYRKVFADKHAFDVLAVFATQSNVGEANGQTGRGFANDFTENNAIGSAISQSISSSKSKSSLDSYLGRISYAYNNKYFVDVTGRVDGSSVFGENRKYGFFPAVSAAWRVIEEPFVRGLTCINDLKLRATYGITGNAGAIGPYGSLATVAAPAIVQAGGGYYYFDHTLQQGVNPTKIPNEDLRWEKSAQLDIGLDIALFNNRVDIVADYYIKRTDDLLFTKPTPLSSGYGSIVGNFASLENKGLELAVNTKIIATPKFRWDASANITFNKNKVLTLDGIQDEIALTAYSILKKGYPLGVYKTYVADGINQVGDVILPGYDGRLGGYKVKDINPDGKIDKLDQQVTGNAQPDYFFGFSTSVKYSRFDAGGFIQGVQGSQMYNAFRYSFETPVGSQNVLAGLANRWSPTNPTNEYAKGFQGSRLPVTNRWVENNSYIRLKNVTIGYTVTNYKFIKSLRIYVSGNNLLTITDYKGWDPESNSINGSKSNNLFIDNGTYPAAKSYVFGIQANF